ncbi:MAG: preprotein translocase subunit SecA, partial [Candidatus Magasanikbacteria bacterium RIFCSPHIGHO2_02_FULL_45_10]
MSLLTKIFGDPNAKVIKTMQPLVDKINALEPEFTALSDDQLKTKTPAFKERLAKGETLDDLLPEAFAAVREASRRLTGMRHFDVQLLGGIALHRGHIAEMRTGEGKTLVATLPTYLNALSGKGVHVVTVNDYLAKRDAVWMGQIYAFLGMSIGVIQNMLVSYTYSPHTITPEEKPADLKEGGAIDKERDAKGAYKVEYEYLQKSTRQEAYACDIVYGTNNEFGFDYLRDNMVGSLEEMSQRGLNFAVVDEVDSILIDEARTPLIISAPAEKAADKYYEFADLVEKLEEKEHYAVDEKMRSATLTDAGIHQLEKWLNVENIYAEGGMVTVHHIEQALRAKTLFKRDRDYVVDNGEVIIVDEFTGRKMPGRRYSEGLHQAIEAKEKVAIQRESQTMATVTFQNYFRMYTKLSGMTGTAVTEAEEFGKIYKLEVVVVPTNRDNKRSDQPDRIYRTEESKNVAIAKMVRELQEKGQPVLVGTISVEKNEALSAYLEREGIKHEILNAKNHEREGEIIAQAGRPGAVTLATNMAGRGVDIILGGNPPDQVLGDKARVAGGLFVIGTERHESRRIDNQLRGRSGRQGDPGETQFYLSTEDDLMRIFAGERIKKAMQFLKIPDDMPIEQRSITKIIESAQKKVEGFHFDTRKHLLEYDDIINRHREVIYGKRRDVLESFAKQKEALKPDYKTPETEEKIATLREMIFDMIEMELEQVVSFHTNAEVREDWDIDGMISTVQTVYPLSEAEKTAVKEKVRPGSQKLDAVEYRHELVGYLIELAKQKYDEMLVKKAPHPEMMLEIEKQVMLRSIDNLWVEHLMAIDALRTGIGLRGYGQRDPLVEYKKETYRMFHELIAMIQKEVVYSIYKLSIGIQIAPSLMENNNLILQGAQKEEGESARQIGGGLASNKTPEGKNIGRNEPCYCGSGLK